MKQAVPFLMQGCNPGLTSSIALWFFQGIMEFFSGDIYLSHCCLNCRHDLLAYGVGRRQALDKRSLAGVDRLRNLWLPWLMTVFLVYAPRSKAEGARPSQCQVDPFDRRCIAYGSLETRMSLDSLRCPAHEKTNGFALTLFQR